MALRARCPGLTLAESDSGGSSQRGCPGTAGVRASARVIGHLLACGLWEMTLNQFAEKLNDGLVLRGREPRPKFLGGHRQRERCYRRGGSLASDMLYFLLAYREVVGSNVPSEAKPLRRL